jgi:hypothetical protein
MWNPDARFHRSLPRKAVTPLDIFNPANLSDASWLTGPAGAGTLLDAAHSFPGGPTMLVFALFWSPVGLQKPKLGTAARHGRERPVRWRHQRPLLPRVRYANRRASLAAAHQLRRDRRAYDLRDRRRAVRSRALGMWGVDAEKEQAFLNPQLPTPVQVPQGGVLWVFALPK